MTVKRPTFSLVIPCYNDGRYAPGNYLDRLLESVLNQDIAKSDIEIIISDDHSPIPYQGTLDRYREKLNIKYIETDYNFAPGNTRNKGASIATGQWLCFADHDDTFYPGALKKVKNKIKRSGEQLFVYCDFNKVDPNDRNKVVEEFRDPKLGTWVHGKFYNLDNLWKKFDLQFPRDLRTHEDIAIGYMIECIFHKLGDVRGSYLKVPVYMWTAEPTSISSSRYLPKQYQDGSVHSFLETEFGDYLRSSVEVYLEAFKKGYLTRDEAVISTLSRFIPCWYNIAQFKLQNPGKFLREPEALCSKVWHQLVEDTGVKIGGIKVIITKGFKNAKDKIDQAAQHYKQPDLFNWLDWLDAMDYEEVLYANKVIDLNDGSAFISHRPFFSLVVACYNDGRYKRGVYLDRLLDSVTKQGLEKVDIEVILSDDCSPVSFDRIVNKYSDKLIIKRTKTDYNCCPGNTRAKGVELACGEWLCFADHDDIFYPDALKKVKQGIQQRKEKYFAFGDFYGVDPEGKVKHKFECTLNWCHGKFYNLDNFWKPEGIHFIKDLKSHEDIAICTQVSCAIHSLGLREYTYLHFPVYAWTDNPQSVSHAKYTVETETGPREFLEVFFDDYIHSTGWQYIEQFKDHKIKLVFAIKGSVEIILYCYFYTQGFQFRRPADYYRKNLTFAGQYVKACKEAYNLSNEDIYKLVASNDAAMYIHVRKLADPGSGYYVPQHTFTDWLKIVCRAAE